MASVIVVDNELVDSVKEYGQIINAANQNTEFSSGLQAYVKDNKITDKAQLLEYISTNSTSESFKKLSDREFEPTFNLLIHITTELGGSDALANPQSLLLKALIETTPTTQPSLRDRKSIKSTSILSILNTIFNLLPPSSKNRIHILSQILNVLKISNIDYSVIEASIGTNLISWLKAAQADDAEVRSIFWDFVKLDTKYSEQSLQSIKNFTSVYQLNNAELNELVAFALSSEVVDVSFLVNKNVAAALVAHASDENVAMFNKYVNGELVTVPSSSPLPAAHINSKSRILALAKFFSEQTTANPDKIIFQYSEIPVVESSREFETLLVKAIKSGVIEGKLNQITETFYLTRVNRLILANQDNTQHWNNVKKALQDWKTSLTNINEIVKASRENIVNSSA